MQGAANNIPKTQLDHWLHAIDALADSLYSDIIFTIQLPGKQKTYLKNRTSHSRIHRHSDYTHLVDGLCYEAIQSGQIISDTIALIDFEPSKKISEHVSSSIAIFWPGFTALGSICVFKDRATPFSLADNNLLIQLKHRVQNDLLIIDQQKIIAQQQRQLESLSKNISSIKSETQLNQQSKSNFLTFVSHEIRTNLNGVLGTAHLLKDCTLDEEAERYIQIINASSDSLLTLLNDMSDYSKIELGRFHLDYQAFNLDALLNELISTYQNNDRQKNINLSLDKQDDDSLWFLGDSIRIRQIITNLLSNAFNYTSQGSITIERQFTPQKNIKILIHDTGKGLSESEQQYIFGDQGALDFGRSFNAENTKLSLAICKQLTELMHGEIGVYSNEGFGSTYWLQLPLIQIKTDPTAEKPVPNQRHKPLKILVAEDNEINLMVLEGFLKKLHQTAIYAKDGKQALDIYMQHSHEGEPFDLILMDCEMPQVNGLECSRAIREYEQRNQHKRTNIVALSAHAAGDFKQSCLEAGMDRHISKPIQMNSLEEVLWLLSKSESPIL